jgi:hypothetical protein
MFSTLTAGLKESDCLTTVPDYLAFGPDTGWPLQPLRRKVFQSSRTPRPVLGPRRNTTAINLRAVRLYRCICLSSVPNFYTSLT